MCLAVAVNLVSERLKAPSFSLGHLAFVLFDDFGRRGRQRIDLSLAQVLTREEDMLIESHLASFHSMPIAG